MLRYAPYLHTGFLHRRLPQTVSPFRRRYHKDSSEICYAVEMTLPLMRQTYPHLLQELFLHYFQLCHPVNFFSLFIWLTFSADPNYGLNEKLSWLAKSIPAQSAVNGATVTNPKEPITVWSISAATYL